MLYYSTEDNKVKIFWPENLNGTKSLGDLDREGSMRPETVRKTSDRVHLAHCRMCVIAGFECYNSE